MNGNSPNFLVWKFGENTVFYAVKISVIMNGNPKLRR